MTATANKVTHTPGPWEAIPAKNEHGEATISIRGQGEFIATMDTVSTRIGAFVGCDYRLPDNGEANARLIAAAPELLNTLKQAVDEAGYSLSGPTDHRAAEHGEPAWVCNARAIIAKANA